MPIKGNPLFLKDSSWCVFKHYSQKHYVAFCSISTNIHFVIKSNRVWTVETRITQQAMPLIPKERHSTDSKILLCVSVNSARYGICHMISFVQIKIVLYR